MIRRPQTPARLTSLFLLIFCTAISLPAEDRSGEGRILLYPLNDLSVYQDESGGSTEFAVAADQLIAGLAEGLGQAALPAEPEAADYPQDPLNREESARYALSAGADLLVNGYYALQESEEGYFVQLRIILQDLVEPELTTTRQFQGLIRPEELKSRIPGIASSLADEILKRLPPLEGARAQRLTALRGAAERGTAVRRTVTITVVSPADPEALLLLPDGSVAGSMADGELSFETAADSLLRFRLEKPGHYPRFVETRTGTVDARFSLPGLYPVRSSDLGATLSYLRPFGGLFEHRLRFWNERLTLGYGTGLFLIPEYEEHFLTFLDFELFGGSGDLSADTPLPDFGRIIVESELGLNLGLYLLGKADDPFRILAEANHRVNLYTLPHQEWRSFLVLAGGPGGRVEWNRPNSIWHVGMRFYFPYRTPLNRTESMFALINGGVSWKR